MIDVNWSAVLGTGGALCSALSFLPQVVKVRRQGGRDLSGAMLGLLLAGAVLWFAYGLINDARSVVVAGTRTRQFPAGSYQLQSALIIGRRRASTDQKTSLNEALRELGVSV